MTVPTRRKLCLLLPLYIIVKIVDSYFLFSCPFLNSQEQISNIQTEVKLNILTPWKWNEAVVNHTKGTKIQQSTRGILLLRATQVPIPEVYQKAFGPKGKPHDVLILELIASIRKFSARLPIVVVVDEEPGPELAQVVDGYIKVSFRDPSSKKNAKPWREKIRALLNSPFEETLYLDSDMKICHDVEPLYEIFKTSEIGFARQVIQASEKPWNKDAFRYEYYGCFIIYRKTERVLNFFEKAKTFDLPDQNAMNKALQEVTRHNDQPNIFTFPAAASAICRLNDLILPVSGPIYTIHGVRAQCGNINSYLGPRYLRCYAPGTFSALNFTKVHTLLAQPVVSL